MQRIRKLSCLIERDIKADISIQYLISYRKPFEFDCTNSFRYKSREVCLRVCNQSKNKPCYC